MVKGKVKMAGVWTNGNCTRGGGRRAVNKDGYESMKQKIYRKKSRKNEK